jgi:hypothetical protein
MMGRPAYLGPQGVITQILLDPGPDANTPPDTFASVIRTLMDKGDAADTDKPDRELCQERPQGLCCTNDEGRPFGVAL